MVAWAICAGQILGEITCGAGQTSGEKAGKSHKMVAWVISAG